MAMAQGPFLVGTAPPFAPVPNPGVTQPQQPSVNIAVSSQQTVQQPLKQQVQQPAYIQQQPQFVQPVSPPQPTTQPSVNIAVSSQQTTQQVQPPAYQYIQQQPQVVQPVNQVVVVQPNLTDTSRQKMCPNCRNTGMTQLRYINGMLTWLICGVGGNLRVLALHVHSLLCEFMQGCGAFLPQLVATSCTFIDALETTLLKQQQIKIYEAIYRFPPENPFPQI
uniref:glutenin, low molecular weight subunit-like n=1 Tax=Gasterosteus aculeatus aculeatus TaxID=481459 RepID=UPI001A99EFD1|nr:glutenin, low molecular weight subunit-like [Gasterosteus aculeatus aculeatus]